MSTTALALQESTTLVWITMNYDSSMDDGYYSSDYESELCVKEDIVHFGATFNPIFFSVVVVLSLLGNILVLMILAKYENLRSLTNAFILNLAVSDLIFTAGLPFWAYYYVYGWNLGEPACKMVSFFFYVGFYSSGILLIMMTAHRYIAVVRPLSQLLSPTGFSSALASSFIWTLSALAATPALVFTKVLNQTHCDYEDDKWRLIGIYQQNILFSVTLLVFCFCYSQILWRLLRTPVRRRRHKTLKLIFTLVVVFFAGWAPYNGVIFVMSLSFGPAATADSAALSNLCQTHSKPLDYAFYITRLIAFAHCCLNPLFYVFVGVKYQNHLKRMLKHWDLGRDRFRSRSSRSSRHTVTSLTSGEEFSV